MIRTSWDVVSVFLLPPQVKRLLSVSVLLVFMCGHDVYAQTTTSAFKNTSYTLHIPRTKTVNDFQFPSDGESSLHIYKDPPRPEHKDDYKFSVGTLSVPDGKFLSLKINSFQVPDSSCKYLKTWLTFSFDGSTTSQSHACDDPMVYLFPKREVFYKVAFVPTDPSHSVIFTITANDKDGGKSLQVSQDTNVSGTINPYGFDGLTEYATNMQATTRDLTPPAGHSVMLSFPHFHIKPFAGCLKDTLQMNIVRINPNVWKQFTRAWKRCGALQLPPEVYTSDGLLQLGFITRPERSNGYSGFKIRFSFHGASELPEKLHTNDSNTVMFNCSVSFFSKFRQHLDCNLEMECLHAEDEANCPYTQGACEPGLLNAGTKCYKYVRIRKIMTWFDTSMVCITQGMKLASFPASVHLEQFRQNILQFTHTTFKVFIGLRTSDSTLSAMYRDVWQWSIGTMAYYVHFKEQLLKPTCGSFAVLSQDISPTMCGFFEHMQFIFCETEISVTLNVSRKIYLTSIKVNSTFGLKESTQFITCSEGHVTHDFLSCDVASRCGAEPAGRSCAVKSSTNSDTVETGMTISMYVCNSQTQTIHYTQVCDHHAQCFDSSDEYFCIHKTCPGKQCLNRQCVPAAQWCDGMAQCSDGSDEACLQFVAGTAKLPISSKSRFQIVTFDGHGKYKYVTGGTEFSSCPPTHFLCADRQLCLPVYVRCNGVFDCSYQEDEDNCDNFTCSGYYRCQGTAVCLHSDQVCDDIFQCPQQDDELLCHLYCPDTCRCQGLAFICPRPFSVSSHADLRYLDASQSGLTPDRFFHNHYLVRLLLLSCGLHYLPVLEFPNMKYLDFSNNVLISLSMQVFLKLSNLNFLGLSGNPIISFVSPESGIFLKNVHSLDLSHTKLKYFNSKMFHNLRYLKHLNLSSSMLKAISNHGFKSLAKIESLDLRKTELKHYPVKMLQPLTSLHVIFSDVYQLCCQDILPEQLNIKNCHTSPDEIASCKDLLRSDIYRMFLWVTCIIAVVGNVGSFSARIYLQRGKPPNSFNVFISHLNFSDFFMGMYLAMIGSADQVYRGTYLWHGEEWKTSSSCMAAGFFSLLSCEMSAFSICFITLDRFLVMRFPFSRLRFGNKSAQGVCCVSWVVGVSIAALPLLPMTAHWEFYSQTDICIPLPITRQNFKGRFYSFGILILLNCFLFLFIAIGQLFIYMSIRENSMATDQKNAREAKVARRLLTVVMSDFLCWFPIGLLGLMASSGISISGEVNVAMAIFALPLNSALNPFLYTFNLLMEKRQKAAEQRLFKMLQTRFTTEIKFGSTNLLGIEE